jgi:hypothetical protein
MLTRTAAAIVFACALTGTAHGCQLSSPDFSMCVELERLQIEKLQMETDALKGKGREEYFEMRLNESDRKRAEQDLQAYMHAHPMAPGAPVNQDPISPNAN